jgi:hypothetical protein
MRLDREGERYTWDARLERKAERSRRVPYSDRPQSRSGSKRSQPYFALIAVLNRQRDRRRAALRDAIQEIWMPWIHWWNEQAIRGYAADGY